jgi:N6-L-threonylcarbamoyladenine synthase
MKEGAVRSGMSIRILGIESSCDETAAAVVADGREILSSVVASQIDIHRKYGGNICAGLCRSSVKRSLTPGSASAIWTRSA